MWKVSVTFAGVLLFGCTPLKADLDPPGADAARAPDVSTGDVGPAPDVGAAPDAASSADARDATAAPATGCPGEQPLTLNVEVRGSTTTPGWDVPLTAWFARSDVACSPATMSALSAGPYQVYTIHMEARSDWQGTLLPDPGVDVGIAAAWQQSATATACYPARDYSVVTCEAAIRNGPGVLERVRLNAITNPYRVYILVNTPSGGARGAFKLQVSSN